MSVAGLVSIIVPTYNRAYCLPTTIASVFEQTYQNFEVIIVDDGSTDSTEQVLLARWPNEPRLRYIRQENAGVSAARNNGINQARGEFIALLDSDDTWLPWKLEVQLACFVRFPAAVMVHSEMEAIDQDGKVYDSQFLRTTYDGYQQFKLEELYSESCTVADLPMKAMPALASAKVWCGDIFSHSLIGNLIHTSTVLIRRGPDGFVERYDAELRTEETFDYHLRVSKRGPVVFVDAAALRYQRGRTDHLWSPEVIYPPKMLYELNFRYLAIVEPHLKAGGDRLRVSQTTLNNAVAKAHGWAAITAAGIGQYGPMFRHLIRSLRLRPWQPRLPLRTAYYMLPRKSANLS